MWYMNEERELLQKMVKDFTVNEVKPFVKKMETHEKYPHEILKKAGDMGILGLLYPERVGGSGEDWINLGIAIEEIAKESNTLALCISLSTFLGSRPLLDFGTPEQIEKILKPIIAGDTVFACSLCEPVGMNNWFGYKTKAVLEGDQWVINGSKIFCTNAGQAEYYAVLAVTSEPNPTTGEGMSLIIVHKDTPGFKVGHIENKLGWHGSSTGQLYFNDCRVPKENILGPVDKIYPLLGANTLKGLSLIGVGCLGSAEGVYEKTVRYCKERDHMGKSLYDSYQTVRNDLAKMWIDIEAYRALVFSCFELLNKGMDTTSLCMAAKVKGAQLFESIASQAVVLHGGVGTVVESDIERYYRDAKMNFIGGASIPSLIDSLTFFI